MKRKMGMRDEEEVMESWVEDKWVSDLMYLQIEPEIFTFT